MEPALTRMTDFWLARPEGTVLGWNYVGRMLSSVRRRAWMPEEAQRQLFGKGRFKKMPDWGWFLLILVAYLVLVRWVLPRLGVPT